MHFALHDILIAEPGVGAILAGGASALSRLLQRSNDPTKKTGLLLTAGVACLAFYRIGGVPAVTAAGALP